ncbi:MAG: hypothetical protein LBG97_02565 [Coriobacteriales bacterium]|jgi:hypothetical protein|nr:hypothetical protein [Coriobacteriales bacterium]
MSNKNDVLLNKEIDAINDGELEDDDIAVNADDGDSKEAGAAADDDADEDDEDNDDDYDDDDDDADEDDADDDDIFDDQDDEEYEKKRAKIIEENKGYLKIFEAHLEKKGLSDKTIDKHYNSVYFYLNTFLLRDEAISMQEGCFFLDDYFGNFFIRRCMWSTPANIKTTSSSLKKFYKCMFESGKIKKYNYEIVCATIKECMSEWQETCAIYNDPNGENPFAFPYDLLH